MKKALREAGCPYNPWVQAQDGSHWYNVETRTSSGARRKRRKRRLPRTSSFARAACTRKSGHFSLSPPDLSVSCSVSSRSLVEWIHFMHWFTVSLDRTFPRGARAPEEYRKVGLLGDDSRKCFSSAPVALSGYTLSRQSTKPFLSNSSHFLRHCSVSALTEEQQNWMAVGGDFWYFCVVSVLGSTVNTRSRVSLWTLC